LDDTKTIEIDVLATGRFMPRGSPGEIEFKEADLDEIAETTNAVIEKTGFKPPVGLAHEPGAAIPEGSGAIGLIDGLRRAGNKLLAKVRLVGEDLADAVKKGVVNYRSPELWLDAGKVSGLTEVDGLAGRKALRRLALLGSDVPAVKDLTPLGAFFADEGGGVAVLELGSEAESTRLRTRLRDLEKELQKHETMSFLERMKQEGRVLPADEKRGLHDFLLLLGRDESVLAFGEGNVDLSPLEWFKGFLESIPPRVDFAEPVATARSVEHVSHSGFTAESVRLHRQVLSRLRDEGRENNLPNYLRTLSAVSVEEGGQA